MYVATVLMRMSTDSMSDMYKLLYEAEDFGSQDLLVERLIDDGLLDGSLKCGREFLVLPVVGKARRVVVRTHAYSSEWSTPGEG